MCMCNSTVIITLNLHILSVLCQLLRCLGAKKLQEEENDTVLKSTTRAVRAALALGVPTSVSAASLVAGNSKLTTLFLAQLVGTIFYNPHHLRKCFTT